jgi:hypothetical protein
MKKSFTLLIILSTFFLAGCANNNQPNVTQNSVLVDINTNTATPINEFEIVETTNTTFTVPEVGIKIAFPDDYTIAKSNEINRRGSFVSYNFFKKDALPLFYEIQFFSKESIEKFAKNCTDEICFMGDFPDVKRYDGQKYAFKKGEDYLNYKLTKINDHNYFTSNFKCEGDSCVIREYTTFIDDTKVDIWINMQNDSQIKLADQLFEKFEIIE